MNKNTSLPMAIANIQGGNNFPELTGQVKFYKKCRDENWLWDDNKVIN